eukprot:Phypoly_transcript_19177.p1 GENE.Phypoly_transcript_19177~~Phypoly_transcript_19177.p1  ORF type:complete len:173 (+),score=25.49 Phypoly_transcript_19177:166-684(+)
MQQTTEIKIDFKEPITKDNWAAFLETWLKAAGLKFRKDSEGDINVRFGNGGTKHKGFDKDFAMLFLQGSKLHKTEDEFIVGCLVIGDQKLPPGEKEREKITEYLARASFGSRAGTFGIMQDRIVFKVSLLADKKTDGNELAQTLYQSKKMFCSYYNYVPDILDGTLSAIQAI